jgi:hypothetical protein
VTSSRIGPSPLICRVKMPSYFSDVASAAHSVIASASGRATASG